MVDLGIRGGTVIDGTGGDPIEADVAVEDGKIVAVGKIAARGAEEIDAKGKIVGEFTPNPNYVASFEKK